MKNSLRVIPEHRSASPRGAISQIPVETSAGVLGESPMPPAPKGSEMQNSIQAVFKPGSQPPLEILMKDLAIWLGKQVGVTYTREAKLEEYAAHALAKTTHSSTS